MLARLLAFVSFALAPMSLPAADFNVIGSEITIRGPIVDRDDIMFGMVASTVKGRATVVLHSNGGSVSPAILIGSMIREKGWATSVPEGARCVSACALIWVSGAPRIIGRGAMLGFHAAYTMEDGSPIVSGTANALIGAYLRDMGLNTRAIAFATSASPKSLRWLTWPGARAIGLDFVYGDDVPKYPDRLPAEPDEDTVVRLPERAVPVPRLLRPVRKETKSELLEIFAPDSAN